MTNIEVVQDFVRREDLSGTELKIKVRAVALDEYLAKARQELQTLTEQHTAKQNEVLAATHQLEGLFALILDLNGPAAAVVQELEAETAEVKGE